MKFFTAAVFAAFLAASSIAQSPSKILKQAEKALGGTRTLQSIRSVSKTGSIRRPADGISGKYISQTSQPNLLNISFDLDGFEDETGYNGRSGWSRNSREGLQTLTGRTSIDLTARALFRNNLWLRYKGDKSKLTSGGQTNIDGKTSNIIILTTQKGVAIKLFFDALTGLPLRDEIPNGDQVETTDYDDYRDVNGLKQAFSNRLTVGGQIYEIRFDDIKISQPIALAAYNFPVISTEPLPNIPSLLKDLQDNEDKVEAILDTYSYSQKNITRELGKDGALRETESETVQLSFYKGHRISRVIEKNSMPLSEKDQADADREAGKQVAEIEKKIAKEESRLGKQGANGTPSEDGRRISIAEVLRASKLSNPRRERFRGRYVIVFDFEPNPAFDLSNAKSMLKFFGKTAGVMWIDEKDKQVARLEAVLFESLKIGGGVLAKLQKGASFTLEKVRVNDEIWLPSQADINLSVRVLLVKGININQIVKSYDYRKFETEVKDAKVDEVKNP
ncbi:MAG: hypothetical protein ABIO36_00185 [Pyrinomonadaceae bacterium]